MQINIKQRDLSKFEMVKHLILQDLTVHYTISHLAQVSQLNTFKLKVGFKQLFKTSIYEFLQHERIKYALHLLNTSDDSIKQIAVKCGYGYATNFTAVFRKKYKLKPSDYRKSQAIGRVIQQKVPLYCYNEYPLLNIFPKPSYHLKGIVNKEVNLSLTQ